LNSTLIETLKNEMFH